MSSQAPEPIEVFFSYSHKGEELHDELAKHLSLLQRQGIIKSWHDRRITAGTEWKRQISRNLDTAGIILLLIGSDFLASDYCYDIEMNRAMERHDAGNARVIPIILRPCDWMSAPFGRLEALPQDAKPVTSWTNRDEAFKNVCDGIRKTTDELTSFSATFSPTTSSRPTKPDRTPTKEVRGQWVIVPECND